MSSKRAVLGFAGGAAALVVLGAALNGSGLSGWAVLAATVAGGSIVAAGVAFRNWRLSIPLAATAIVITAGLDFFGAGRVSLLLQLAGMALLAAGGVAGGFAYAGLTGEILRREADVETLNARLGQKHLAFLAATSDAEGALP